MRRLARVLLVVLLASSASGTSTPSTSPVAPQILEMLPEGRSYNTLILLSPGQYAIGGEHSTGSQSWDVEPSVGFRGMSVETNFYTLDGVNVSDIERGSVMSFASVSIFAEEARFPSSGGIPEYGAASAGILDHQRGGTGIVNVITRGGAHEFCTTPFSYAAESLSDLTYDEDCTLWGAGMSFDASGPVPALGFFEQDGTFIPIDTPVDHVSGYFQGIHLSGIGIAYGCTMPGDVPVAPVMTLSWDNRQTWGLPPILPWEVGTINAAQFVAPYLWVAGETPEGAAFARTEDGGMTWTKQIMPEATYIWDMEIARVTPSILSPERIRFFGAALGTHYLDDGAKESIVFRTLDGEIWEESWRIPGYGGAIDFDALGHGAVAMVQNAHDGATLSLYAAYDFFGARNLVCGLEIIPEGNAAAVDQPFTMRLEVLGPWGALTPQEPVVWTADVGRLVVNAGDPLQATLTVSDHLDVTVTCTLPDLGLQTTEVITVGPSGE